MIMQQTLFDALGQRVLIGPELGRGGEGAVYALKAVSDDYVAKLYFSAVTREKALKLQHMVECQTEELKKFAAWPLTTLYEHPGGATPLGFVMTRIPPDAYQIHQIYDIQSRFRHFPKADWAFLVHAAMNCAAAFEAIHERGHVIGDVNNNNVVVRPNATIYLIDCDSYQIAMNGSVHRCAVGVPEYTPPELQNVDFNQITRTPNHDNFGLAVLIFQLLFMRHPFSGIFIGPGDAPSMPRLIQEYRFPFGRKAKQYLMEPPLNWPTLDCVPSAIADLFERAFSQTAVIQTAVIQTAATQTAIAQKRPVAAEWRTAMEILRSQLSICDFDASHIFHRDARSCPWCDSAGKAGVEFFVTLTYSGQQMVAAEFTERTDVLDEILGKVDSFEVLDDDLMNLNITLEIPPMPPIVTPPKKPQEPSAPAFPAKPVEPVWVERKNDRRKIINFIVLGIAGSVLGLAGIVLSFLAWGFWPFTCVFGCAVLGRWFFWLYSLTDHSYWMMKKQFELGMSEYKDEVHHFQRKILKYEENFAAYQGAMVRHGKEMERYKIRMKPYLRLVATYEPLKNRYENIVKDIDAKLDDYHQCRRAAQNSVSRHLSFWNQRKIELQNSAAWHQALKSQCDRDLARLNNREKEEQLKEYLENICISDPKYKIPEVGKVRLNSLIAHGIVNAWQIVEERLHGVPYIGPAQASLLSWRQKLEEEFRYHPKAGVPVASTAGIVRKWQRKQNAIEKEMMQTLDTIRSHHLHVSGQLDQARTRMATLKRELSEAIQQIQQ